MEKICKEGENSSRHRKGTPEYCGQMKALSGSSKTADKPAQPTAGTVKDISTADLEAELARREFVREELQRRIYTGELEVTDADGVETMTNQGN